VSYWKRWRCKSCHEIHDEVADVGWLSGYPAWLCRECVDSGELLHVTIERTSIKYRKRHDCKTCEGESRLPAIEGSPNFGFKQCDDCKDDPANVFAEEYKSHEKILSET